MATSNTKSLKINIDIPIELYIDIVLSAQIGYWADFKSNKTYWSDEKKLLYVQEFDDNKIHILDYNKFCKGLQKLFRAECSGSYKNRYHNVVSLLTNEDYDASYADDIIQFSLFGEIIYS